jgi:ABC-type Zn uptake system ZnuABC Zn-binding protein ZnuA
MRRSFLLLTVLALGCTKPASTGPVWPDVPGPKVVASFPPIACFVKNVLGDRGTLRGVMSSQGPHDFDPGKAEAQAVAGAELFVLNGLELDNAIATKMKRGSGNASLAILDLGSKLDDKLLLEGECHHDHKSGEPHHHDHGFDSHLWLGPDLAQLFVATIRDELKKIDPDHAAAYDRRAAEYAAKLAKLLDDGKATLKSKSNRKIVTMHESMGYFARAFGVEVVGSIQSAPGQEPTRKKLDEIVAAIASHKVAVIAVEPQYTSTNAVKAIQRELKAKGLPELTVIELDPMETAADAVPAADWYETKMRANLTALAAALK